MDDEYIKVLSINICFGNLHLNVVETFKHFHHLISQEL